MIVQYLNTADGWMDRHVAMAILHSVLHRVVKIVKCIVIFCIQLYSSQFIEFIEVMSTTDWFFYSRVCTENKMAY